MSNLEFFHIFLTCNQDIKDNLKKAKGNNAVCLTLLKTTMEKVLFITTWPILFITTWLRIIYRV